MKYTLEISKIIDGAMRSDRQKVLAYVEQMARKLEEDGEAKAAKTFRDAVNPSGQQGVALSDLAASRLPVDSESRLQLADEIPPPPEPLFVALPHSAQETVEQFLRYTRESDRLIANGVGVAPSMLIYGPPGCGKTSLARHIAASLRLPLLVARSDSLISSFLGSTAKNLRALFEHAMGRPSVLFLDEFDAFAKVRDDQHELGELKRVVVSLIQNIYAMDGKTVLLAATNHEHLLDTAVWRRFAYKLHLVPPSLEERVGLFQAFLHSFGQPDHVALFASASETLTGAQVRHICQDAIRDAVLAGSAAVDDIAILRNIARARIGQISFREDDAVTMRRLRDLDRRVFTGKRIAAMYKASETTISRRLRESVS